MDAIERIYYYELRLALRKPWWRRLLSFMTVCFRSLIPSQSSEGHPRGLNRVRRSLCRDLLGFPINWEFTFHSLHDHPPTNRSTLVSESAPACAGYHSNPALGQLNSHGENRSDSMVSWKETDRTRHQVRYQSRNGHCYSRCSGFHRIHATNVCCVLWRLGSDFGKS